MPYTYVEVPRLQTQADKIDKQLSAVLSQRPQMYAKTKERYRELAISLLASVEKIATILEVNSLASPDSESSEFSNHKVDLSNLSTALNNANQKIDSYTSFVTSDVSVLSSNVNKETLKRYGQILDQAANYNFSCTEATECAYILNKWFKARFSTASTNSKFKYNIAYIPNWITDIIIIYGKYHSRQDTSSFMNMMTAWCDSLSDDSVKWAVPYEVYQLNKTVEPMNYTMNAVLIGDILMDEAFYQLTESNSPDIVSNLECYPVAAKVKANNPSLLPTIRSRLARRDILMEEYRLNLIERRR